MTCKTYKQHELGKINDKEYQAHVENCALCREIIRRDDFILKKVKKLKKPVKATGLWERINDDLQGIKRSLPEVPAQKAKISPYPFLKLAASFLIPILLIGLYFLILTPGKPSGLLTGKALEKVEKMEISYMAAISELEELVKPGMDSINIELALCYRDRLETIDEQIKLCKKELEENPANTHIRRYLLAALQDKKQTLIELNALQLGGAEN